MVQAAYWAGQDWSLEVAPSQVCDSQCDTDRHFSNNLVCLGVGTLHVTTCARSILRAPCRNSISHIVVPYRGHGLMIWISILQRAT